MVKKERFLKMEKLYHFTSYDTALIIIESNRLRFSRLTNMNDIHENDKIVFVNAQINSIPSEVFDSLHDEIYKYRQISLTADDKENDKDGFDLHQMWGLYAEKGEGVCLVFDKKELEKSLVDSKIHRQRIAYDDTPELESFVVYESQKPEAVLAELESRIPDIFFHKRKEWEHEQEYRLLKRCPDEIKEEYLLLGHALKYVIMSSKLRTVDEVRYFKNIKDIAEKVENVEKARNIGEEGAISILIYGNGLFNYTLGDANGNYEIWNSNDGYETL